MFQVHIHVPFCIVTDHCYILCKYCEVSVSLKGERGSKVNHHVHIKTSTCSISRLECQILMSYMDFDRFNAFASLSFFYPNEYMTGVGPAHGLYCKTL